LEDKRQKDRKRRQAFPDCQHINWLQASNSPNHIHPCRSAAVKLLTRMSVFREEILHNNNKNVRFHRTLQTSKRCTATRRNQDWMQ
jgi:hypothetical protein